ncbi:ester cyclase [Pendulispora rubella]|uniref:Ester cyclase n=1 Tax=Pendulispora rubella TaxID=2741070 RepID=A0ABZ2L602_9BACT
MERQSTNTLSRTMAEDLWARWTAMWNGDTELARAIIADGFYVHLQKKLADPATIRDPEAVIGLVRTVRAQYAEIRYETNLAVLVDGDTLIARWFARGIFAGRSGRPEDVEGRTFRIAGIDILRIENGRIRECWTVSNPTEE